MSVCVCAGRLHKGASQEGASSCVAAGLVPGVPHTDLTARGLCCVGLKWPWKLSVRPHCVSSEMISETLVQTPCGVRMGVPFAVKWKQHWF